MTCTSGLPNMRMAFIPTEGRFPWFSGAVFLLPFSQGLTAIVVTIWVVSGQNRSAPSQLAASDKSPIMCAIRVVTKFATDGPNVRLDPFPAGSSKFKVLLAATKLWVLSSFKEIYHPAHFPSTHYSFRYNPLLCVWSWYTGRSTYPALAPLAGALFVGFVCLCVCVCVCVCGVTILSFLGF